MSEQQSGASNNMGAGGAAGMPGGPQGLPGGAMGPGFAGGGAAPGDHNPGAMPGQGPAMPDQVQMGQAHAGAPPGVPSWPGAGQLPPQPMHPGYYGMPGIDPAQAAAFAGQAAMHAMPYYAAYGAMPHAGMAGMGIPHGHGAGAAAGGGPGMADVMQEIANGGNGLSSLSRLLNFDDSEFWKGALVGAAAVLLLTNESVQNALFKTGVKAKDAVEKGVEKVKAAAGRAKEQADE